MSYARPSLSTIVERVKNDFLSKLDDTSTFLRRSLLSIFSSVIGGVSHLLHGHIDYIANESLPDRSEDNLVRQAAVYYMSKTSATFAAGNVTIMGTEGEVISAGTELQRSDGWLYETDTETTIGSGETVTLAVTALDDGTGDYAGEDGNCDEGTELTFTTPQTGVDSTCEVASGGLSGGSDEEDNDSLRERLLYRMGNPPQGGAETDYIKWAREVSGVTRAWCYPKNSGEGTVGVAFVRDNDGIDADIIPSNAEVEEVQDYIDELRPVTANVTVFAPIADEIDFTITISPSTAAVKAAVEDELRDLLYRDGEPGGTIKWSNIAEAISIAAGEAYHVLTSPSSDIISAAGHIPVMGDITWA